MIYRLKRFYYDIKVSFYKHFLNKSITGYDEKMSEALLQGLKIDVDASYVPYNSGDEKLEQLLRMRLKRFGKQFNKEDDVVRVILSEVNRREENIRASYTRAFASKN